MGTDRVGGVPRAERETGSVSLPEGRGGLFHQLICQEEDLGGDPLAFAPQDGVIDRGRPLQLKF